MIVLLKIGKNNFIITFILILAIRKILQKNCNQDYIIYLEGRAIHFVGFNIYKLDFKIYFSDINKNYSFDLTIKNNSGLYFNLIFFKLYYLVDI